MGDRRVTALDMVEHIQRAAGDTLPANWLTVLCTLPILGEVVPRTQTTRDLFDTPDMLAVMMFGGEAVREAVGQGCGEILLAILQVCNQHEIDLGLAFTEALAREVEKQPTGEADQ